MSDRMTLKRLRAMCESLNARMESRGSRFRYEVGARYDYKALDRIVVDANGRELYTHNVVRVGPAGLIGEILFGMMVALDDASNGLEEDDG